MKLHLQLSPNKKVVSFDYQKYLVGKFNEWTDGIFHNGNPDLYSMSGIYGKKYIQAINGWNFKQGGIWSIGVYDNSVILKIIENIWKTPDVLCGMSVEKIILQESPNFSTKENFKVLTPGIFIKRNNTHITFENPESDKCLTETILNKSSLAGIKDDNISIKFDRNYKNAKIKLMDYKGIKNKVSVCPIIIEGSQKLIQFAWEVGVGNSTGIGFGAITK